MADRFPSLEEINDGDDQPRAGQDDSNLISDSTDTNDFLSRERAALGDDADLFSTPNDATLPSVSVQDGDDDLLGGSHTNGVSANMNSFQSSFPPVNTQNERMAPGGTITGSASRPYSPAPNPTTFVEEPALIKEWRERRNLAIQSREEASAGRKQSTVSAAQESIDEFYENYNNKKEKSLAQTRKEAEEFLAKREDTTAGGTSWERIAKLVDLKGPKGGANNPEGKDKFRELLAGLTKDENAPGAKGY